MTIRLALSLLLLPPGAVLACAVSKAAAARARPFVATTARSHADQFRDAMLIMDADMGEAADEPGVDAAFLRQMIPHHRGAVHMAQVAVLKSKDPRVKSLARSIIANQQNEIRFMELLLAEKR